MLFCCLRISEELDVEKVMLYQHTDLPHCIPEQERDVVNDEATTGTTAEMEEDTPIESEETESIINEEEPLFLLQESEAPTSADEDRKPEDENTDVEPPALVYDEDEDDEESDAKESSAAACDYETLVCEGEEAKSTAQEVVQLLFEAESSPVRNVDQQTKPIGADWDNSFLQDDDQVDLVADITDKEPLLEENLVGRSKDLENPFCLSDCPKN